VGCEIIRSEKVTGTTRTGRSELASVLEFIRPGDELVVTRIDRLARSIGDLQDIVRELKRKGAFLRAADQPIDTSTAAGKAFLDMLAVFAEFETNLRRERQLEGIAKAIVNIEAIHAHDALPSSESKQAVLVQRTVISASRAARCSSVRACSSSERCGVDRCVNLS
jgi:DNA invertase Pin-like site-specific DNA recombinase